jgi:hypothetical protein
MNTILLTRDYLRKQGLDPDERVWGYHDCCWVKRARWLWYLGAR